MNSKQESRFSMHLVARDFLVQNAIITAALPNFAIYFAAVRSGIERVSIIREQQELDKKGFATNKRLLRINLIAQAIDISRKIVAYSSNVNNVVLLEEVNYSKRDLNRSQDTILKDRCRVIYDRAFDNRAALELYGVTEAILITLSDTINSYDGAIPTPRLGTLDTKDATRQLKFLLKDIDENYTKIDILVEIIRESNSIFYNQYKTSRKIIYIGRRTTSLMVSVKDKDGNGIANVSAVITNIPKKANSKEVVNKRAKKTTLRGAFKIIRLAEGNYLLILSKYGFATQTLNFSTVNGEITRLDLRMKNEE